MREQQLVEVDRVFLHGRNNITNLIDELTSISDKHGTDVIMKLYHEDDTYYTSLKFFKLKDVYTQQELLTQFKQDLYKKCPELAKRIFHERT